MAFLKKRLDARDYWLWYQHRFVGLTFKEMVNELPKPWKLSEEGINARFDRFIRPCLEEARKKFRPNT